LNHSFFETLALGVYFMNELTMQSTHQPKNAHNKIQFMTSLKLLHVSAPGLILQKSSRTKKYKYDTLN